MGDENPICTIGDYSKPSHESYRNTIELPEGNNVVPLRSDTILLVQNGCSFHKLRSKDPNQHLKNFLKLVDSLDLNGDNKERTRLVYFNFPFTIKLAIGLNVFQQDPSQHERILLLVSLLNSFHREGLQNSLQVQLFYDRIDKALKKTIDYAAKGRLMKLSAEKAWATIDKLSQYEDEGWNNPVVLEEGNLDYENPDIEQLLGVMEYKVDTLMKD
ncbi:hypothetical protein Tco_1354358 [Tanacetum coccineum]